MKKISFFLAATAFLLYACGGKESGGTSGSGNPPSGGGTQPASSSVTLTSPASPVLEAKGGTVNVTFTASEAWTAKAVNNRADGWLSISPESGTKGNGKVTLSVSENDSGSERSATVQIKAGSASANVTLTQKQNDALTLSANKTQVGKEATTVEITVKANVDYTYAIEAGDAWIHYQSTKAVTQKTLTFAIDANEDVEPREGRIAISSSLGKETVTIYQEGSEPKIVLSSGNITAESVSGVITVDVSSNVAVTVTVPESAPWITQVVTRSMSTNSYSFALEDNPSTQQREADILFTNAEKNLSESVHVTQRGKNAQELGIPGVYGILGLNWTYAKSAHQLLSRRHDESHLLYAFMDPVQNKFISLEVFGRMDKDNTVSVNILQNVSSSVPGQRTDYSLHVDKVEGGLVWLSSANQPTEQVILKIQ